MTMLFHTTAVSSERLAVYRQCSVALAASSSYIIVGIAYAWPSPVLPQLLARGSVLHLDTEQASWVVSVLCLGTFLSPFPSGYLADKVGRQKTILCFGLLPVISWLLVLLTTSVAALCLSRVLLGMHLGAMSTVLPVYIGEISQPSVRGSLNTLNNMFYNFGSLMMVIVGPLVSYESLAAFCLLISITSLVLITLTPESPYYIIRNKVGETTEVLFWLRGNPNPTDVKIQNEVAEIKNTVETRPSEEWTIQQILKSKASRKALVIGLVYSAGRRVSGEGAMKSYVTVTLPQATFGVLTPNDCALILGITTTISSFLVTQVSDYFGRKTLAAGSFLGSAISNSILAAWYLLSSYSEIDLTKTNFVPFVGSFLQSFFINFGGASMLAIVKSEMFPSDLKSIFSAICTVAFGATSFVVNKSYLIVAEREGVYVNFLVYAVCCFLTVLCVVIYVPETKGKSFKEIQDILNDKVLQNT